MSWPPPRLREYRDLRDAGASAKDLCRAAKADGLSPIGAIRLLHELYGFPLGDAKRLMHGLYYGEDAEHPIGESLDELLAILEHEERLGRTMSDPEVQEFLRERKPPAYWHCRW